MTTTGEKIAVTFGSHPRQVKLRLRFGGRVIGYRDRRRSVGGRSSIVGINGGISGDILVCFGWLDE